MVAAPAPTTPPLMATNGRLRADFSLRETYHHEEEPPLTCPISAFGGMADEAVRTEQLEQWRSHTAEGFQLWLFQGDHFFIRTAQSVVVEAVTSILQPYRQMLR